MTSIFLSVWRSPFGACAQWDVNEGFESLQRLMSQGSRQGLRVCPYKGRRFADKAGARRRIGVCPQTWLAPVASSLHRQAETSNRLTSSFRFPTPNGEQRTVNNERRRPQRPKLTCKLCWAGARLRSARRRHVQTHWESIPRFSEPCHLHV